MFRRLFLDHPAAVGESYGEHFGVASRFGLTMIGGGICALLHAFIPAVCKTTGSRTVARLNQHVVDNRAKKGAAEIERKTVEYVI